VWPAPEWNATATERVLGAAAGLVGAAAGLVGDAAGLVGDAAGLPVAAAGLVGDAAGLVGDAAGLVVGLVVVLGIEASWEVRLRSGLLRGHASTTEIAVRLNLKPWSGSVDRTWEGAIDSA